MAPTQPFRARNFSREREERSSSLRHGEGKSHKDRHSTGKAETSNKTRNKQKRKHAVVSNLLNSTSNALSESEHEDSDLDLEKPLYAIGDYLHNRKELVVNMFTCLKGDALSKMIPEVLREFSIPELQEKCVYELDGMSRKKVRAILSANEVLSSSGTEDSGDELPHTELPAKLFRATKVVDSPLSGESHLGSKSVSNNSSRTASLLAPTAFGFYTNEKSEIVFDAIDLLSGNSDVDKEHEKSGENSVFQCFPTIESTDVEIMELELRRNALRSMMQQLEDEEIPDASLDNERESQSSRESKAAFRTCLGEIAADDSEKDLFEIHVGDEEMAEFD